MNGAIKVEPTLARARSGGPSLTVEVIDAESGAIRVATPIGVLMGPKDTVLARLSEHGARLDRTLVSRTRAYERTGLGSDLRAMVAAAVRWSDWHDFLCDLQAGVDGLA